MKDARLRNKNGKFVENTNSLHPKSIAFKVSKQSYPRLLILANSMGLRPGELVREVMEKYLEEHWSQELEGSIGKPTAHACQVKNN